MKITLLTGKIYDLESAFDFPLVVSSKLGTRRMSLRIDAKKRTAILNLPRLISYKRAHDFVQKHQAWIESELSKIPSQKLFQDQTTFLLFGQEVTISHLPESLSAPYLQDHVLYLGGDPLFIHRRVKDFIKKSAQKEFLRRSRLYAEQLGVHIASVTIKDTSSRWGSCSSKHNLNYNWRIALAPDFVIDYLMAHEVSHLKHPDHSPAFWHCVKTLYSGSKLGRSWLRVYGGALYEYL